MIFLESSYNQIRFTSPSSHMLNDRNKAIKELMLHSDDARIKWRNNILWKSYGYMQWMHACKYKATHVFSMFTFGFDMKLDPG